MAGQDEKERAEIVEAESHHRFNTARFFVDNPSISSVLLVTVMLWGLFAYLMMPKSKDPDIPVRIAMATTQWPGQSAMRVEELVTRKVEEAIAQSEYLHEPDSRTFGIKSLTLNGVSMVQAQLAPKTDVTKAFNDLNLKLIDAQDQLPTGAGRISLNSEFGDTAAVLLAVASPRVGATDITLRAEDIREGIAEIRGKKPSRVERVSIMVALPLSQAETYSSSGLWLFADWLRAEGYGSDFEVLNGSGYMGVDFASSRSDSDLLTVTDRYLTDKLSAQRFFPDAWKPFIVRDIANTRAQLAKVAGAKYSYRQLDDFSDLIASNIRAIPEVKRVLRSGVLTQEVNLVYSQERLASYGLRPDMIAPILNARNTTIPGGTILADNMDIAIMPSGDFINHQQIADVPVTLSHEGTPIYLRGIVDVIMGYQTPPPLLNYYLNRGKDGQWQRSRSINLSVQMLDGRQIGQLGRDLDKVLERVKVDLPKDLIIERVSDQPRQVRESVSLFLEALVEAIILVVIIAFIGFSDWRSAVLLMISIPITLAMTFGFIQAMGVDIQQVSIAALIIALGLLVDDPVVASDAIKRQMAAGKPSLISAWLGPTLLAKAIFFATLTNVVAYLPFLLLTGNQGDFLHSLPIVMACALVASRIVSMTFLPFLGNSILRPPERAERSLETRRKEGLTGRYYRAANWAIDNRKIVLLIVLALLVLGVVIKSQLKNAFFPADVQYLSYVDIWLQNDASINATNTVAKSAERVIMETIEEYQRKHRKAKDKPILEALSTTLGSGAPRFWFTINPQQKQPNYGQIIIRLSDKNLTPVLTPMIQQALTANIPGAYLDVRQLQTSTVTYPFEIRVSGRVTVGSEEEQEDIALLRQYASKVRDIVERSSYARTVRSDWAGESLVLNMNVLEDRASMSGVTNADIALASSTGFTGTAVDTLRQGDKEIPIVARLRLTERGQLQDVNNLYIFAADSDVHVPLRQVATTSIDFSTERINRLEKFRTITVYGFPYAGFVSSDIMADVGKDLKEFSNSLPSGYQLQTSGDAASSQHGFIQLLMIMAVSSSAIFLALVFQFSNLIKPLVVFATVPLGMVGALVALYITGQPFGFMAFLGIVSLIGVIVSHIIVLFDFIELRHSAGDPFREALLDAGILRLRPILITIAATTFALVPLAIHGGPLWRPLCFAQIGGLILATCGTLFLVPVIYTIMVEDLKWIRWKERKSMKGRDPSDLVAT
ncbi:efflux RND transporter permease subunit [Microbulbifer sp. OS29]|uniref:Efflux RND transporter permease subunit n=1 Tax=Microbulbifer okhotskensis TaxID=2926617 RepID=A0A9X2J8T7_9GAMM|nr:efflux RND transporter permease subunit [Microbulbifer okhotskensis]MCO1335896.1 efflux RND transporter permease subunit [Microbulbifer okhotskensis]